MTTATRTIPDTGVFTITEWAEALDMSPAAVREYIQRHAIPTDGQTIDAAEWWSTLATAHDQKVCTDHTFSGPPAKRNRRRRKGATSGTGLELRQLKQRLPRGKLIAVFLAALGPAEKQYATAWLLEQARKAQQKPGPEQPSTD